MTKLTFLAGGAGLGLAALLLVANQAKASDHLDSAAPMADINDVYAWMSTDGSKVNLAMTISPGDDGTRRFGPGVQYVFHLTSKSGLGVSVPGGTETKVICTFTSDKYARCWVVTGTTTKDFIAGDPSNMAGIVSANRKVRMFAGRRSDPFFFNQQGFRDAVGEVKNLLTTSTRNAAGCPDNLTNAQVAVVLNKLQEGPQSAAAAPCATDSADCFIHLKVQAIVLQIDKALLNDGTNNVVSVWGSTHTGS